MLTPAGPLAVALFAVAAATSLGAFGFHASDPELWKGLVSNPLKGDFLMGVLGWISRVANIWYFGLGAHPDEEGGVTTSALVLSVQEVPENFELRTAAPVMTGGWSAGVTPEAFIAELPVGPAVVVHATSALDALDSSGSAGAQEVWQGKVAVPFPTGGKIAILELSTAAVEHAADYLEVLCAMAYTIKFGVEDKPHGRPPSIVRDRIREALG